jgi:hypothetical protein
MELFPFPHSYLPYSSFFSSYFSKGVTIH